MKFNENAGRDLVPVQTTLEAKLLAELDRVCRQEDRSRANVMRQALRDYLRDYRQEAA